MSHFLVQSVFAEDRGQGKRPRAFLRWFLRVETSCGEGRVEVLPWWANILFRWISFWYLRIGCKTPAEKISGCNHITVRHLLQSLSLLVSQYPIVYCSCLPYVRFQVLWCHKSSLPLMTDIIAMCVVNSSYNPLRGRKSSLPFKSISPFANSSRWSQMCEVKGGITSEPHVHDDRILRFTTSRVLNSRVL